MSAADPRHMIVSNAVNQVFEMEVSASGAASH